MINQRHPAIAITVKQIQNKISY